MLSFKKKEKVSSVLNFTQVDTAFNKISKIEKKNENRSIKNEQLHKLSNRTKLSETHTDPFSFIMCSFVCVPVCRPK